MASSNHTDLEMYTPEKQDSGPDSSLCPCRQETLQALTQRGPLIPYAIRFDWIFNVVWMLCAVVGLIGFFNALAYLLLQLHVNAQGTNPPGTAADAVIAQTYLKMTRTGEPSDIPPLVHDLAYQFMFHLLRTQWWALWKQWTPFTTLQLTASFGLSSLGYLSLRYQGARSTQFAMAMIPLTLLEIFRIGRELFIRGKFAYVSHFARECPNGGCCGVIRI